VVLVGVVVIVAGCAHAGSRGAASTASPELGSQGQPIGGSSSADGSAAVVRRSAAQWLARVSGCADVHTLRVRGLGAAAPALATRTAALQMVGSAATCSVEAHQVVLLAFTGRAGEQTTQRSLRRVEPYLAAGSGWLAVAARPDSPAQTLSVVQGVALSLGGTLITGVAPPAGSGAGTPG
jgi:hypothetical protein